MTRRTVSRFRPTIHLISSLLFAHAMAGHIGFPDHGGGDYPARETSEGGTDLPNRNLHSAVAGLHPLSSHGGSSIPIVLPLRLMHEDVSQVGGRYVVSVQVHVSDGSDVDRLWLHAHNLSYAGKGSVRVNGGAWIDLDNTVATCVGPEVRYECVGGSYATIRMTVPVSGVVTGENSLEFSFNGSDGLSTGWRVLRFNLLPSSFTGLATVAEVASVGRITNSFVFDDPDTWEAPRGMSADVLAGEQLWSSRNRLRSEPGGRVLWASCSDCHARDGRDLQYFNYSNESIVVRSKFHGLSQEEAEQVASFIRSRDLSLPAGLSVSDLGRPWDPPYQPGPGLDARPVEQWSAGAGLDEVLEDDGESLSYMFPAGIGREVASTKATLNLREIPVAIQLFDWNGWLPRVHPMDSFFASDFEQSEAWLLYRDLLHGTATESVFAMRDLFLQFDNAVTEMRRFLDSMIDGVSKSEFVTGRNSLQLWQLVKVWEVMQTYGLEDKTIELYGANGEARSWFSKARSVFNIAPHIAGSAEPPQATCCAPYPSPLQNKVASHRWYHLQMILNAGHRDIKSLAPVDWKYQFGHIADASGYTGEGAAMRLVATYLKMIQMMDNGRGIELTGWYVRHMHPYRILKGWDRSDKFGIVWSSVSPAAQRELTETLLRAWLEKTLEFAVDEWPRGSQNWEVDPSTYTPVAWSGRGTTFEDEKAYADNFYRVVQVGGEMGVAPSLLDSLADWGAMMWPNGDWETLVENPSNVGAENVDAILPAKLSAIFPNPVSHSSSVYLDLEQTQSVTFTVVDVLGRLIDRRELGILAPGRHVVKVEADRLPSGVYFCQVRAGNFLDTRRITVVK